MMRQRSAAERTSSTGSETKGEGDPGLELGDCPNPLFAPVWASVGELRPVLFDAKPRSESFLFCPRCLDYTETAAVEGTKLVKTN